MSLKPDDWGVVVIGRWNPAILTPAGIKNLIFKMRDEDKVEVAVPMDGISPYLVKNPKENIVVVTEPSRLLIKLETENFEVLDKAKNAAINALESLPQTPFNAAGYNIRYKSSEPISTLNEICESKLDGKVGDLGLTISARSISRRIVFKEGQINFIVQIDKNGSEILFNFHLDSNSKDQLVKWLGTPVSEIESEVNKIMSTLQLID